MNSKEAAHNTHSGAGVWKVRTKVKPVLVWNIIKITWWHCKGRQKLNMSQTNPTAQNQRPLCITSLHKKVFAMINMNQPEWRPTGQVTGAPDKVPPMSRPLSAWAPWLQRFCLSAVTQCLESVCQAPLVLHTVGTFLSLHKVNMLSTVFLSC